MPEITKQQLIDAGTDAQAFEDIVNGSAVINGDGYVDTRTGGPVKTISKVLADAQATLDDANNAASTIVNNFIYSSNVTMGSPGTGTLRLNNATIASATALAIMNTTNDNANPDIDAYINSWDDSTNPLTKGYIYLRKKGTPATFAIFRITGALTDNTTWKQIPIVYMSGNGTFSNNDEFYVGFVRSGDALLYSNLIWGSTGGGTANAQTITPSPTYSAYGNGDRFQFIPNVTNTGSATLNVASLGAKTFKKLIGNAKQNIAANDILQNVLADCVYDGTDIVLLNPQTAGSSIGSSIAAAATLNLDSSTGDVIDITGNTGITAITLREGTSKLLRFTGTPTITNGASLIINGGTNWTPSSSDNFAIVQGYASGVVRLIPLTKATAVIQATTSAQGIAELATAAEILTGTDVDRIMSPGNMAANFSKSGNYYIIKLPGGYTLQLGQTASLTGGGTSTAVTLPYTYPTEHLGCIAVPNFTSAGGQANVSCTNTSTSQATIWNSTNVSGIFNIISWGK